MRTYKFLTAAGVGVFSRFAWPLPQRQPGPWVTSAVEPCRAGIHACRSVDLPYWTAPALFEIELDGPVEEQAIKVVATRGRLVRRIDAWNAVTQDAYGEMCVGRAHELVTAAPDRLRDWAPPAAISFAETARLGFMAARIAEELAGPDGHREERGRQSAWLVEHLDLG